MKIVQTPEAIASEVAHARRSNARIGFVPTMGALHEGHLGLIHRARTTCDAVVCSIFVNPLQFNDPKDLEKYPRRIEADAQLLKDAGCDLLFTPEKEGIFADFKPRKYDLGGLDLHWEGPSRPGHFQGVVNVVERLFFYVRPDEAFFGEKDRQQLAILQHVARSERWPEKIVPCPTSRERDGLARSSRNMRLNTVEREEAGLLYKALQLVAVQAFRSPVAEIHRNVGDLLGSSPIIQLDHFGLADPLTLRPIGSWEGYDQVVALIAAQVGPVRLIDNMLVSRN